jgi:hypothetical protein
LENGDHLTRDEFERRYEAMPHVKKAELIEGIVYISCRVNFERHGCPHAAVMGWLGTYRAGTPGVGVGNNATVRLDVKNEFQPDALMIVEPHLGGQATIDSDGYIAGGPELVCEVAASSAAIDLNTKLRVYRRSKVREYVVWRVLDEAIDWFVLRRGRYIQRTLTSGTYRSDVFPGLWLDPDALVGDDLPAVLQALQQGLASAEHVAFVAKLRAAGAGRP